MDVREKLIRILTSEPEMLKDLNVSSIKLFKLVNKMIAHGVTVQEWIPVAERLPDSDGKYLVARYECGKYSISVRKYRKEVPCWYRGYCGHWERRTNGITHWMPLPEPPKGG